MMSDALGQAKRYVETLDAPPPLLLLVDIGHCVDLFASFDGSRAYHPFPNALSNRTYFSDLEAHLPALRAVWEEPLRAEWDIVRTLVEEGTEAKIAEAEKAVRAFHEKLCGTRVLDPACGTGNFLYVTLDLFKRLEAEVVRLLRDLRPETGASGFLDLHGVSVTPRQLLGIEVKRWTKEIAELVLWIGWLQWHFRTHGDTAPDETARVVVERYVNPRKAELPEAEFVV